MVSWTHGCPEVQSSAWIPTMARVPTSGLGPIGSSGPMKGHTMSVVDQPTQKAASTSGPDRPRYVMRYCNWVRSALMVTTARPLAPLATGGGHAHQTEHRPHQDSHGDGSHPTLPFGVTQAAGDEVTAP